MYINDSPPSAKEGTDTIPMHALGTPEDVAEAVRHLVSDEAHYLTGALIPVAGGWLMM
jgi:3-oxoacyl-[acyl-carrier protein] reductase